MHFWSFFSWMIVAALLAVASSPAQEPRPRPTDPIRLPPGTVILVVPNPKDLPANIEGVFLTPEEYRKLLEATEKARSGSQVGPQPPSVCQVKISRVDTGSARATVQYRFRTDQPRAVVLLGLQRARPISATLAGAGTPALLPSTRDDGLQLVVDKPGEHELTVEVDVPVRPAAGRGRQSIEFGLPGSAVSLLESARLPAGSLHASANGQLIPVGLGEKSAMALGPARMLDVTWDTAPVVVAGDPQWTVESAVETLFDDVSLKTTARLHVRILRGSVGEFQVSAPATTRIAVEPADAQIQILPPGDPRKSIWTIRRTPSAHDLILNLTLQQAVARRPIAVPGFPVVGSLGQRGTVTISYATKYRPNIVARPDLVRTESPAPTDGMRRDSFAYSATPSNGTVIEFDPQLTRTELDATVAHQLNFTESEVKLTSRWDLKPNQRGTDRVEFEVPGVWHDVQFSPIEVIESVAAVRETPAGRVLGVRLHESSRKPFFLELSARCGHPSTLPLPCAVGVNDRGGSIAVAGPLGAFRGTVNDGDSDRPLDVRGSQWVASTERAPLRLEYSRNSNQAVSTAQLNFDITLGDRQLRARLTLRMPTGDQSMVLRGPAELTGRVRLVDGGTLTPIGPGEWQCQAAPASSDCVIEYAAAFPETGSLTVPLLWPDATVQCDSTVRIWSTAGRRPVLAEGAWSEIVPGAIPDFPIWPALAARTLGNGVPLRLEFPRHEQEPAGILDRGWVEAWEDNDGWQVRAQYRVRNWQTRPVNVRVPANWREVDVRLDDRLVNSQSSGMFAAPVPVDSAGHVITIAGRLPPSVYAGITAPELLNIVGNRIRWSITPAAGKIVLDCTGGLAPASRWGWASPLLGPSPEWTTRDLDRWVGADRMTDGGSSDSLTGLSELSASVGWVTVPRFVISVIASLAALGTGLLLVGMPWTARRAGLLLLAAAGLAILAAVRPWPAGQVFAAASPGLVVLPVIVWLTQRSRRRVSPARVFAPPTASRNRRNSTAVATPRVSV
ncbi:MAG: hypothetical protein K1X57_08725 [Gemmataceae bacterium]|nr:hypothetical protein [Gemmataceae bacterium]